MAFTVFNTSDTLEQARVKLNNLTQNDFGDPALLAGAGLAATSIVGAVVEIAGVAFSAAGFFIRDESSTIQNIGAGQTLDVVGAPNQITAVVSAPDLLTIGLASDIIITGNLTAQGALHSFGTISINNDQISSSSTAQISIADRLIVENSEFRVTDTSGGTLTIGNTDSSFITHSSGSINFGNSNVQTNGFFYTRNFNGFVFEGTTVDDFETALRAEDPTSDNAIVFPDRSGTVITNGDTGTVTNTMLAGSIAGTKLLDDSVTEAKIADDAVGIDQLKSVVTLQILNSSGGVLKFLYGAGA
jgi:hypothetical protein